MCELFPVFRSCCGIPVRIALVFIAVLSIVTGAMINAALKKAGVNIASIDDVKKLKENFRDPKPRLIQFSENDTNVEGLILVTNVAPVKYRKYDSDSEYSDIAPNEPHQTPEADDDAYQSTVEIVGEDSVSSKPESRPAPASPESDYEDYMTTLRSLQNHLESTTIVQYEHDGNSTNSTQITFTQFWDGVIRNLGVLNRNGMNMLAASFIVAGILLLVANFINHSDLGLVCVIIYFVITVAGMLLLIGVTGECVKTKAACLLTKMDWLSQVLLCCFWFVYIIVWVFFTGVVNAFANTGGRF